MNKKLNAMPERVLFKTEERSKDQWKGMREAQSYFRANCKPGEAKIAQVLFGRVHPVNGAPSSLWIVYAV